MTLYSWSANVSTHVPVDAGGCGSSHRRPVVNGAPQHPWALECPPCEDFLRTHNSDQWSANLSELPETHDEKIAREDFDKRGAKDRDQLQLLILAKLADIQLPPELLRPITGNMPHLKGITHGAELLCPDGHENAPGQKFCGECAAALHGPAPDRALEAPAPPAAPKVATNGNGHDPEGWQPPRDAHGRKKPMRDWRREDLQAYAHQLGVDPGGLRDELIERLQAAKKEAAGITG